MFLSLPAGTEMFQFPAFAPCIHGDRPSACRVAPFGHIRINVCLRLPVHFRSLPRPSSPPDSLGILRSLLSSFSRESRSLSRSASAVRSDSILVSFAYMKLQSLIRNSKKLSNFKLQTDSIFSIFTSYSLSMLSMNFRALPGVRPV